jgi:hypothetical protein
MKMVTAKLKGIVLLVPPVNAPSKKDMEKVKCKM